ncbi:MAG: DMT family transporter [Patescibacteria group bacterium]
MNGVFFAIIAQVLLGTALIIDKFFLKERPAEKPRAVTYAFWIGILNTVGFVMFFAGPTPPTFRAICFGLAAGLSFLGALVAYYIAIERSNVSQSAPIMGGFSAMATLGFSSLILGTSLSVSEGISFAFLALGAFVLLLSQRIHIRRIIGWVFVTAILFGLGNTLQKVAFNESGFVTGFLLTKAGGVLAALFLLLLPSLRRDIFHHTKSAPSEHRFLYLGNRFLAGIGAFLIFFAISKSNPPLIEALSGLGYVVVFILAAFLTRFYPHILEEKMSRLSHRTRILGIALILVGTFLLGLQAYYTSQPKPLRNESTWGFTFSVRMAEQLGIDWRRAYIESLDELAPDGIRLVAYWDRIEREKGVFLFDEVDWQVEEARKRNIQVILTIGQKVPRWPECHFPSWLNKNDDAARESALLTYLKEIVSHYKNAGGVTVWQVENEPFLLFGECPSYDTALLEKEIALVKSIDPTRPVLTTDGGEFGDWYRAAKRADLFGTTLYRKVFSDTFGHFTYPLAPEFYPLKRDIVQTLLGDKNREFIVIELGLEPWDKKQINELPISRQIELFSPSDFAENIEYTKETKFKTVYLWGVEWWYWMRTQGNATFWNLARQTFQKP